MFKRVFDQFQTFALLPGYIKEIAKEWTNILFGEGVLAVIFLVWWALGSPPLVLIFVSAVVVAGFYAWRASYVRLIPKLKLNQVHVTETPTADGSSIVVIHLIPECLTEAPVEGCSGHLLRVLKKPPAALDWSPTEIDEPSDLTWSIYDDSLPRTLHPGVSTRLNLCCVARNGIRLMMSPTLLRWGFVFNAVDAFGFDVRITAKDSPPVDSSIVVKMGAVWNHPEVAIS